MFARFLTTTACMYWGALQRWCIGLMCETTLQTFGGDTVFTVKTAGASKTETGKGWKWDLTSWTRERNGVNLALTFTTSRVIQQKWDQVTRNIYIKHD